ncbi:hypothetical protein CFOL_v3_19464, partial [Cephalotus follicularis]
KYASDIFKRASLIGSKTSTSPLEQNVILRYDNGELLLNPILYRQLVGSLVYLTMTRLDIVYVVHLVIQFMDVPRSTHFVAVLCILRYVKETLFYGLFRVFS